MLETHRELSDIIFEAETVKSLPSMNSRREGGVGYLPIEGAGKYSEDGDDNRRG
jgi:hypothetical protein